MKDTRNTCVSPPRTLPEAAVRTLRHEIGDFLQTIYAMAAILGQRLPQDWELERRILGDMRARGDACKSLIDLTHDLICPIALNKELVDLREILTPLLAVSRASNPKIRIEFEQSNVPPLEADSQRMAQVCLCLLADACKSANDVVRVSLNSSGDADVIHLCVQRDGQYLPEDQTDGYFGSDTNGYQGPERLALILVGKIVAQHGGRIRASNVPEGGVMVTIEFPMERNAIG